MIPLLTSAASSQTKGALVPIAHQAWNGPGSTDSFYFNNIPQTYKHLYIVWHARGNNNSDPITSNGNLRINNDTSASLLYSSTWVEFNGAAGTGNSSRESNIQFAMMGGTLVSGINVNASTLALNQMYIFDYTSTTKFKTTLFRSSLDYNGTGKSRVGVGLYRNTAAVTGFNVYSAGPFPTNYLTLPGSYCSVYGIRAVGQ